MKSTAEKSAHTTPTSEQQKSAKPFFAKAGGGDFFAPARQAFPESVQTKLTVNRAGDKFEQEADHMADKVMRMPASGAMEKNKSIQPEPEKKKIQRKETGETTAKEEQTAQQSESKNTSQSHTDPETTIRNKTSAGQPLPKDVRNFMEPRFGSDFSNVRIHHDTEAAQLNSQLNAKAFTHQNQIFFGAGQYRPELADGKHLLAHELTHVVQQGAARNLNPGSEKPGQTAGESEQVKPVQSEGPAIQRGILDTLKEGAKAVVGAIDSVISTIGRAIGMGVSAATSWIQGIAGQIGAGISSAWNWINGLASRIGQNVTNTWNWIQGLASRIGQNVTSAWNWIQGVASRMAANVTAAWELVQRIASRLATNITNAWNWVQNVASKIATNITNAWNWVQSVASNIATNITNAWNWVQSVASNIAMNITNAWNWVQSLASDIAMNITAAWNWVQAVAARIGLHIPASFNWIKVLASRIAMRITNGWNWIQGIASRIATNITNSWNWVQSLASRIAMRITNAWNWIQSVASRVAMNITAVWNWIQGVASRIAATITNAWNWMQAVASRIALAITSAWNWIQSMASRIAMVITRAWNWIQAVAERIVLGITNAWIRIQAMAAQIKMAIVAAWNWLVNLARQLARGIITAFNWIANVAASIAKAILAAFNWLLNLAKRLLKSLADAWDWYLHAPDVDVETDVSAPSGGKSRSKVGVGEKLTFKGSKIGDWQIDGGTPVSQAWSDKFAWTAPNRNTTVTVSLTSGKYTRKKTIQVLEPKSIKGRKLNEIGYPRGVMGAGMYLKFIYLPTDVSFSNIESGEVSGPATEIKDYFAKHGMPHYHNSGDGIFPVQTNNENSEKDKAATHDYDKPWENGSFKWVIPNRFRVKTEGGDGKVFTEVHQTFKLEGPGGKTTITKAGVSVDRKP